MIDFDGIIERRGTLSYKWDFAEKFFGEPDLLPLWVADMDLTCCQDIVISLKERASHPIYGYTLRPENHFRSIQKWMRKRHGLDVSEDCYIHSPSVLTSLGLCIREFSELGDGVIIQPPVYKPFFDVIQLNRRKTLLNHLVRDQSGRYTPDIEGFSKLCRSGAKIFILCSPHNPVGRVWTSKELQEMGQICLENGVLVLSDEIHGDLVYEGFKHIPFAALSKDFSMNSLTMLSPAKTFNVAGLHESAIMTENKSLRDRIASQIFSLGLYTSNAFGALTFRSVYSQGDEWYENLMIYLSENRKKVIEFFDSEIEGVSMHPPEATYLAWIDFEGTGFSEEELDFLLVKQAGVALEQGIKFSPNCAEFKRLNFGLTKMILETALERIKTAFKKERR
ncbi:pyridoxal phosphate-dependent aminotransferase [candidate division WOR-3 bacterium]|nr:pyridoxal phosphate-dependent aminotransferase [candidate division WOR-3 bacterium]